MKITSPSGPGDRSGFADLPGLDSSPDPTRVRGPEARAQELGRRAFSETSDPSAYIPRHATESALSSIEVWAHENGVGSTLASLVGPPGLGKTMLLRIFESRILSRTGSQASAPSALYLPYAGLPPVELTDWIYGLLGRSLRFPAPLATRPNSVKGDHVSLNALLELSRDPAIPFFLLVDDADSMPMETQRTIVSELPDEGSPLRILMAMNDDAKASRMLAGFDTMSPRVVRLSSAMNEAETDDYVAERLRGAGADSALIESLDSETRHRFFALSGGNPQALHKIAGPHFDAEGARPSGALDEKQRREDWMGRPFEDEA